MTKIESRKYQPKATGQTVADNVTRLREASNLNIPALGRLMGEAGHPMTATSLTRLEAGERRIDVDDLMALSIALGVTPITLMTPDVESASDHVEATAIPDGVTAAELWEWLRADAILAPSGKTEQEWLSIGALMTMLPAWEKREAQKRMLADMEEMRAKRREELERLRETDG